MTISVHDIKQVLANKGVRYLYHANTVATSITFLNNGGLLSRGAVEERGLYQTPQVTDQTDKIYGIFNDVFFDSCDIEARANKVNKYGPVLFKYDISVLDYLSEKDIKITQKNPCYWENDSDNDNQHYFNTLQELEASYSYGNFAQQLTICDVHEALPFSPFLKKIQLDNPFSEESDYFVSAWTVINQILESQKLNIPVFKRNCTSKCQKEYRKCPAETMARYFGLHE